MDLDFLLEEAPAEYLPVTAGATTRTKKQAPPLNFFKLREPIKPPDEASATQPPDPAATPVPAPQSEPKTKKADPVVQVIVPRRRAGGPTSLTPRTRTVAIQRITPPKAYRPTALDFG